MVGSMFTKMLSPKPLVDRFFFLKISNKSTYVWCTICCLFIPCKPGLLIIILTHDTAFCQKAVHIIAKHTAIIALKMPYARYFNFWSWWHPQTNMSPQQDTKIKLTALACAHCRCVALPTRWCRHVTPTRRRSFAHWTTATVFPLVRTVITTWW